MKALMVSVILLHVTQHTVSVEVDDGETSVVLPCTAPPGETTSVVWSRTDLNPPTIHVRRNSDTEDQQDNPRFRGRTSMKKDALITKDVSLTLNEPQVLDSGSYTCTVRGGGQTNTTQVQLTVNSKREKELYNQVVGVSVALAVVVVLFAISVGVAYHYGYLSFTRSHSGPGNKP